ncbi:nuclear receptor coactivator 5-like isoform X1 [Dermochelys coriacea]|uniref:nuclear receptor coactivator 5-like isoform X1 n=1 Tax=Dermochelys coriacea TaxID=27794 RepID=UPI0018E817E8|nr:nuclear receptor coactivator 5-like isoform X1 [Dermochelys coriacea]XP_043350785.1 nuclear receptor coactivator 5-like isoform X1 [Dermochelys coriacea]
MSSWVKVTRGQVQKPIVDKRHRPGWIPRLLDINPYRPYQKSPYSPQDGYSKDFEDLNSFEELFGQQYDYSPGNEDYYERYQYSQKAGPSLHEIPGIPGRQEAAVAAQQPGSSRRQDPEHESSAVEVGPTTPCSREKWRTARAASVVPPAGVSPLPVVDDDYTRDDRREKLYLQFYQQIQKEYDKERPSDCIIVAISKEQTEYATVIGHRLQDHGLVVEMIYLTSELGLTRALQEVKNDGSPFCILVEQSNVALSSCTVIMLHESIKIHRNMPMEDALALVVKAFGKIFAEREQQERAEISHKAADLADDYLERELYGSYSVPLGIRHLLFLLSEGKYLYREELNSICDYLKTRKDELEALVEQTDPSTDVENTLYQANVMPSTSTATHTLSKPPPLLPTPNRNVLLGQSPLPPGKPALLGDRPSGALLPTPGMSGAKGKPPPLLAAPAKRPGLLGYSPHQPAKRPLLGEKPGLLPTPAVHVKPVPHQRAAKPKPLLN